jgi:hypothetical protein
MKYILPEDTPEVILEIIKHYTNNELFRYAPMWAEKLTKSFEFLHLYCEFEQDADSVIDWVINTLNSVLEANPLEHRFYIVKAAVESVFDFAVIKVDGVPPPKRPTPLSKRNRPRTPELFIKYIALEAVCTVFGMTIDFYVKPHRRNYLITAITVQDTPEQSP